MGEQLSLVWAIPFVGILLFIALCPLFMPHFWHHHFAKVAIGWALIFAVPFVLVYGQEAIQQILHITVLDYVPFVLLLWALFTVSGGIVLRGTLAGTPLVNSLLILLGTMTASLIGTTGASMLFIRPVLKANEQRRHKAHTIVFFIFLVSNIGGALTPLGDPPLFLGFLHGVPFLWTAQNLWLQTATATALVLGVYFLWDSHYYARESEEATRRSADPEPLRLEGSVNFLFLGGIVVAVLVSGSWKPDWNHGSWIQDGQLQLTARPAVDDAVPVAHETHTAPESHLKESESHESHRAAHGLAVPIQNLARDGILIAMALLSLAATPKSIRVANGFSWGPILEVAWLFAGIFITILPALAILGAGERGALGSWVGTVREPAHYFWASGILSSFLDNAPTYLTFFNAALGRFYPGLSEAEAVPLLLAEHARYLVALSCGAVFMGANTYIGNAPNFMVRSIAEEAGIRMPDFFSYILKYSVPVLGSTFAVLTILFFRG